MGVLTSSVMLTSTGEFELVSQNLIRTSDWFWSLASFTKCTKIMLVGNSTNIRVLRWMCFQFVPWFASPPARKKEITTLTLDMFPPTSFEADIIQRQHWQWRAYDIYICHQFSTWQSPGPQVPKTWPSNWRSRSSSNFAEDHLWNWKSLQTQGPYNSIYNDSLGPALKTFSFNHLRHKFGVLDRAFPKIGVYIPKWMVKIMVPNPMNKMDDLGGVKFPWFWLVPPIGFRTPSTGEMEALLSTSSNPIRR